VIAVVAGRIEPGYSEVRDAISVLGARDAARPWLFDTGVAIWGSAFILAALALALDAKRSWRLAWTRPDRLHRARPDPRWLPLSRRLPLDHRRSQPAPLAWRVRLPVTR
jgi:hypothetical protein